jgi:hypothetical protein
MGDLIGCEPLADVDIERIPTGCLREILVRPGGRSAVRLVVSRRTLPGALGLLLVSLFWNGILVVFVTTALWSTAKHLGFDSRLPTWLALPKGAPSLMSPGMTIFMWIFLTPFMLIGVGLILSCVHAIIGKLVVEMDSERVLVRSQIGPGPLRWTRSTPTQTLRAVRVVMRPIARGKQHQDSLVPHVEIVGERLLAVKGLAIAARRRWLAASIWRSAIEYGAGRLTSSPTRGGRAGTLGADVAAARGVSDSESMGESGGSVRAEVGTDPADESRLRRESSEPASGPFRGADDRPGSETFITDPLPSADPARPPGGCTVTPCGSEIRLLIRSRPSLSLAMSVVPLVFVSAIALAFGLSGLTFLLRQMGWSFPEWWPGSIGAAPIPGFMGWVFPLPFLLVGCVFGFLAIALLYGVFHRLWARAILRIDSDGFSCWSGTLSFLEPWRRTRIAMSDFREARRDRDQSDDDEDEEGEPVMMVVIDAGQLMRLGAWMNPEQQAWLVASLNEVKRAG